MRTPTPVIPRNLGRFSRIARAVFGSDSVRSACARQPIDEPVCEGCDAWPRSPLPLGERAAHSCGPRWLALQVGRHSQRQRKDAPSGIAGQVAVPSRSDPMLAPAVSRREPERRWRLSTAGFQSRRQADCACSLFFPRSVGFGPTASCAKGALTIAPSMLCQVHAMPSKSSYSANPLRHSRTNTPWRFHCWKYLWIELALPNRSSGNAFHWHPVRSTYTIPSKTLRASNGLRPPPGFRRYFRPLMRFRAGISGSTLAHISSDTVHDLTAFMPRYGARKPARRQASIYG